MRHRAAAALFLTLATLGAPASAQILRGRVLEGNTERGVSNAEVILLDSLGGRAASTLSDSAGLFRLTASSSGKFRVRVERLGYRPTEVDSLTIDDAEEVLVVLRLGIDVIPGDPIQVTARSRFFQGRLQEYYDRKRRMEKLGIGRYMTREEIEARPGIYVTDLLRSFPSISIVGESQTVYMRRMGQECQPQIYLDGVLFNRRGNWSIDEFVTGYDVEGLEVYPGLSQGIGDYHDPTGCGVILVWTRRGSTDGAPWSWWRLLAAGGLSLVIFLLLR